MARVCVVVEGQTEEAFVNQIVAPALLPAGVYLYPILVGKPGHRGGVISYQRARGDVLRLLKQDRTAHCTTMFDYFRLPGDFPAVPPQGARSTQDKASQVEQAFSADVAELLGDRYDTGRFIPYIQMHEFEGLLFSSPTALAAGIGREELEQQFQGIRDAFSTPEDIDDGPTTAPSKRILGLCSGYSKPTDGALAAIAIGIDIMRDECPHFDVWIGLLEALG